MRRRTCARAGCVGIVLCIFSGQLRAADLDSSPKQLTPDEYVAAALQAEADGDFLERQSCLASAASCEQDSAQLKWQQGYVLDADGSWITIDECIQRASKNGSLAEYERRRAALSENLDNHLALAMWCLRAQLPHQARAHYERVLEFDADHVPARLALGYQLVAGEWVSPASIAEIVARGQRTQASLSKFGVQLQSLAADMTSAKAETREGAIERLFQLTDPNLVPAVEYVFSTAGPETAKTIVQWLGKQDNVDSSHVLLRYASRHSSPEIRAQALGMLKQRPLHDFVPQLLDMLTSPISSVAVPQFNRDGTLAGYSQAFTQEDQNRTKLLRVNTRIARATVLLEDEAPAQPSGEVSRAVASAANTPENLLVEREVRALAALEAQTRNALLNQQNHNIAVQNARIAEMLSEVANQEFLGDPRQMWRWWDDYNETEYQAYKPNRYRETNWRHVVPQYRRVSYRDLPERTRVSPASRNLPPRSQLNSGFVGTQDCFVAGTQVLTTRGYKSIEKIVAGDTVFTRDTRTGALLIRPVLQHTQRPPSATITLTADGEQLRCSNGHVFWVSGAGWKKASEIEVGDILHSIGEPAVVTSVVASEPAQTFNMEVADTGTLFIGKCRVLTRDVTPRTATHQVVPGLHLVAK